MLKDDEQKVVSQKQEAEEEIQFLRSQLSGDNAELVANSVFRLGCLGRKANAVLPEIIMLADAKDDGVRANAVAAIGRLSSLPDRRLTVLLEKLRDDSLQVRQYAAAGIGCFPLSELHRHNAIEHLRPYIFALDPCLRTFVRETFLALGGKE